jgi:hypothetical protein
MGLLFARHAVGFVEGRLLRTSFLIDVAFVVSIAAFIVSIAVLRFVHGAILLGVMLLLVVFVHIVQLARRIFSLVLRLVLTLVLFLLLRLMGGFIALVLIFMPLRFRIVLLRLRGILRSHDAAPSNSSPFAKRGCSPLIEKGLHILCREASKQSGIRQMARAHLNIV